MGVADLGQILSPSFDVQFFQHLVGAIVLEELGDSTLRVVEVSKNNGVRGTNLGTRTIN